MNLHRFSFSLLFVVITYEGYTDYQIKDIAWPWPRTWLMSVSGWSKFHHGSPASFSANRIKKYAGGICDVEKKWLFASLLRWTHRISSFFLKLLNTVTCVLLRSTIKFFSHTVRAMTVTNRNDVHGIKEIKFGKGFLPFSSEYCLCVLYLTKTWKLQKPD